MYPPVASVAPCSEKSVVVRTTCEQYTGLPVWRQLLTRTFAGYTPTSPSTLICQKSILVVRLGMERGANSTPNVHDFAVSGFSCVLPPCTWASCPEMAWGMMLVVLPFP